MINKILLSALLVGLLSFGSQAKADWVMDFGPSTANPIADGLADSITGFSFTGDGSRSVNHISGHSVAFNHTSGTAVQSATIRYEFPSLYTELAPGSDADDLVRFSFDVKTLQPESQFLLQGSVERASGGANYAVGSEIFFTNDNVDGNYEFLSDLTIADILADDVVALEFNITSIFTGGPGFDNVFTFGGANGLVAAPEPTSAAMIGCALVGLIARRRRKA